MKKVFVITCKYTPEKSFVYGSVDNILKHYPRSDIIIVDSCSEDKTYLADLRSKYPTVITEDVCNQNYEYGATVHAFNKFKNNYDVFFFLQDTVHIVKPIPLDILDDNTALMFDANTSGLHSDAAARERFFNKFPQTSQMPGYVPPEGLFMCLWNSFIIKSNAFKKVVNSEIFKTVSPPVDKVESRMWERLWSTMIASNGIQIKVIDTSCKNKLWGGRS